MDQLGPSSDMDAAPWDGAHMDGMHIIPPVHFSEFSSSEKVRPPKSPMLAARKHRSPGARSSPWQHKGGKAGSSLLAGGARRVKTPSKAAQQFDAAGLAASPGRPSSSSSSSSSSTKRQPRPAVVSPDAGDGGTASAASPMRETASSAARRRQAADAATGSRGPSSSSTKSRRKSKSPTSSRGPSSGRAPRSPLESGYSSATAAATYVSPLPATLSPEKGGVAFGAAFMRSTASSREKVATPTTGGAAGAVGAAGVPGQPSSSSAMSQHALLASSRGHLQYLNQVGEGHDDYRDDYHRDGGVAAEAAAAQAAGAGTMERLSKTHRPTVSFSATKMKQRRGRSSPSPVRAVLAPSSSSSKAARQRPNVVSPDPASSSSSPAPRLNRTAKKAPSSSSSLSTPKAGTKGRRRQKKKDAAGAMASADGGAQPQVWRHGGVAKAAASPGKGSPRGSGLGASFRLSGDDSMLNLEDGDDYGLDDDDDDDDDAASGNLLLADAHTEFSTPLPPALTQAEWLEQNEVLRDDSREASKAMAAAEATIINATVVASETGGEVEGGDEDGNGDEEQDDYAYDLDESKDRQDDEDIFRRSKSAISFLDGEAGSSLIDDGNDDEEPKEGAEWGNKEPAAVAAAAAAAVTAGGGQQERQKVPGAGGGFRVTTPPSPVLESANTLFATHANDGEASLVSEQLPNEQSISPISSKQRRPVSSSSSSSSQQPAEFAAPEPFPTRASPYNSRGSARKPPMPPTPPFGSAGFSAFGALPPPMPSSSSSSSLCTVAGMLREAVSHGSPDRSRPSGYLLYQGDQGGLQPPQLVAPESSSSNRSQNSSMAEIPSPLTSGEAQATREELLNPVAAQLMSELDEESEELESRLGDAAAGAAAAVAAAAAAAELRELRELEVCSALTQSPSPLLGLHISSESADGVAERGGEAEAAAEEEAAAAAAAGRVVAVVAGGNGRRDEDEDDEEDLPAPLGSSDEAAALAAQQPPRPRSCEFSEDDTAWGGEAAPRDRGSNAAMRSHPVPCSAFELYSSSGGGGDATGRLGRSASAPEALATTATTGGSGGAMRFLKAKVLTGPHATHDRGAVSMLRRISSDPNATKVVRDLVRPRPSSAALPGGEQ